MIRNPVRLTLSLLAALALVALPAASHLAAQGSKGHDQDRHPEPAQRRPGGPR